MDAALETLFLPLQNGDVPAGGRTLFIGAAGHPFLKNLEGADVWQPFKPLADTLGGYAVRTLENIPEESAYDLVLVNVPKQGEEARYWLACGLRTLKPGGTILIAAANDAGGGRIRKWLEDLDVETESLSKNKARAVWGRRPENKPELLEQWIDEGSYALLQSGDGEEFVTQPGVFGWSKIDMGSGLLAEHFDNPKLKGRGADFGAGIGYLSRELLIDENAVKELHLMEADARALICARENMKGYEGGCTLAYHWADLTKPQPQIRGGLDFIVMNPPFHAGAKTDIGIGRDFIQTAARTLRKGGTLLMVANRQLPYEAALSSLYSAVRVVVERDGFKVIEAIV